MYYTEIDLIAFGLYNNSTVKLALSASGHAFGVRASTGMWVLLFMPKNPDVEYF